MKDRTIRVVNGTTIRPSCDAMTTPLLTDEKSHECYWAASIFVGDKGYCRTHTAEAQAAIDELQAPRDDVHGCKPGPSGGWKGGQHKCQPTAD